MNEYRGDYDKCDDTYAMLRLSRHKTYWSLSVGKHKKGWMYRENMKKIRPTDFNFIRGDNIRTKELYNRHYEVICMVSDDEDLMELIKEW